MRPASFSLTEPLELGQKRDQPPDKLSVKVFSSTILVWSSKLSNAELTLMMGNTGNCKRKLVEHRANNSSCYNLTAMGTTSVKASVVESCWPIRTKWEGGIHQQIFVGSGRKFTDLCHQFLKNYSNISDKELNIRQIQKPILCHNGCLWTKWNKNSKLSWGHMIQQKHVWY